MGKEARYAIWWPFVLISLDIDAKTTLYLHWVGKTTTLPACKSILAKPNQLTKSDPNHPFNVQPGSCRFSYYNAWLKRLWLRFLTWSLKTRKRFLLSCLLSQSHQNYYYVSWVLLLLILLWCSPALPFRQALPKKSYQRCLPKCQVYFSEKANSCYTDCAYFGQEKTILSSSVDGDWMGSLTKHKL